MERKRVVSKKHKRTQDRRAGTFRIGQAQPTPGSDATPSAELEYVSDRDGGFKQPLEIRKPLTRWAFEYFDHTASSAEVSLTGTPFQLSQSVVETPQTAGRWQSPSMPGPLSELVLPLVPRCESASTTGWSPANGFGVTRWLPVRLSHKSWNL